MARQRSAFTDEEQVDVCKSSLRLIAAESAAETLKENAAAATAAEASVRRVSFASASNAPGAVERSKTRSTASEYKFGAACSSKTQRRPTSSEANILEWRVAQLEARLNRQQEVDRRRTLKLEARIDAEVELRIQDQVDLSKLREKCATQAGVLEGLAEEFGLAVQRIDEVDERSRSRLGNDPPMSAERGRNLEKQMRFLEQQIRLAWTACEETQKRQAKRHQRI
jgi:uncharacterized protein YlxP (DUF503 family)